MYTLRQATEADYAFLYHLHKETMKDYVAQTWGWDEVVQAAMFKDRFDPEHSQIVVVDGRDAGFLSMEWRTDTLFLSNLQILSEEQGHGLGTEIIKTILAQAYHEGKPVTLQVLKVNPALHLYERLGFIVTGETTTHYLMRTTYETIHPYP
jgi:GNAT superfamily N-acetyltransferase